MFNEKDETLLEGVIFLLRKHQQTISVVESCTGGLLTHLLSTIPGSSKVLNGGWICYTNKIKHNLLKIPHEILEKYGAISPQTAKALAELTRSAFQSDFALSITGVAGPDTCEGKPVGQIYIGLAEERFPTTIYPLLLEGSRQHIQLLAAKYALYIIQQRLKKGETINEQF